MDERNGVTTAEGVTVVTMPMMGLTMEEGTIARWLKRPGEPVAKDEPLLEVEMEKATAEVPSPAGGTLLRTLAAEGDTLPVRAPIAEIGPADAVPTPGPTEASEVRPVQANSSATGAARVSTPPVPLSGTANPARQFVSPRARRRAAERSVDLATVIGSGPNGRVVEADVLAQAAGVSGEASGRINAQPLARGIAADQVSPLTPTQRSGITTPDTRRDALSAAGAVEVGARPAVAPTVGVEPLGRMRRGIAARMTRSWHQAPHVTLALDADVTEAARLRSQLQAEFARLGVPKLPWDALIAKAAARALVEHPAVHAEWVDGEGIRRHQAAHVGIAIALGDRGERGLVAPVLRDAHTRPVRELAQSLLDLANRARASRLTPADLTGATFTVTNLGAYRIDGFTPILNPPQAAVLGVGRIAERPVVIRGGIEPRTLCTMSLSFDHRVVDGAPAAAFLARLAELLERPYALLEI